MSNWSARNEWPERIAANNAADTTTCLTLVADIPNSNAPRLMGNAATVKSVFFEIDLAQ